MKCFIERYFDKTDAENIVEFLKRKGHNVYMEYRFNTIKEVDVWHVIANCPSEKEYDLIKSDLQGIDLNKNI